MQELKVEVKRAILGILILINFIPRMVSLLGNLIDIVIDYISDNL